MSNSLDSPPLKDLLERLHSAADARDEVLLADVERIAEERGALADSDLADLFGEAYIPVPAAVGRLLYILARSTSSRNVVEFGTSFGISTIYLAAAVRDNGKGRVIATEMNAAKVREATRNFEEAGLLPYIDLREGDALQTLRDIEAPVDFLLLDGWKNLYLPVLKVIEPKLRPGSLVVADDLEVFPEAHTPYLLSLAEYSGKRPTSRPRFNRIRKAALGPLYFAGLSKLCSIPGERLRLARDPTRRPAGDLRENLITGCSP